MTQQELGRRAGLSAAYIKMLEGRRRPMSHRPAVAIATATAVDVAWLMGRYRPSPIVASFNRPWSKGMAEELVRRKTDPRAAHEDADHCLVWFMVNSHRLAKIILSAYKSKRPMLALARLEAAMASLADEFKVQQKQLPFPVHRDSQDFMPAGAGEASTQIVNDLIRGLKAEIRKRPEVNRARRG